MKYFLLCLLWPLGLTAQTLPDTIVRKIDSVFRSYTATSPGCAVAVTQNGAVVFQKGYGMANLEYAVPNTPNTIFHIASESKQYVAFCMLLLEKEGKLSLDDDIRKHLDYVPDFGHTITIRHLIYHTSGLRDQWQLLANAGWHLDDVILQEHIIRLVSKQKALNFTPGEEWLYCNTGYTLLAEIVKKVSGLSLREYTQKNIFEPLGMKDTHFHDNYQEIVPGRAYSYYRDPAGKYWNAVLSYSTVGATSLFTTVLDEVKWMNNYTTGTVGGKDLVAKMLQTGTLNDGRKLIYAFGLNVDKYKGWEQVGHGGADAGFRTYAVQYPEKGVGIVVFSNFGGAFPSLLANQVADLLITDPKTPPDTKENFVSDSALLKKLPGRYYTTRGDRVELVWQNGKLHHRNPGNKLNQEVKLTAEGSNRYKLSINGVMILDEKNRQRDSVAEFNVETSNSLLHFKRQPAVDPPVTAEFAGKYFSGEIEAFYTVTFKEGQLTLEHRKYPPVALKYMAPDQFTCSHWFMSHIRFVRDSKKKIVAFEVNTGRVQGLRYGRVK